MVLPLLALIRFFFIEFNYMRNFMYTNLTISNKSLLKRFSHGTRFKIAIELLNPSSEDTILDFGTGDGFMLKCILSTGKAPEITGYEPVSYMYQELKESLATEINNEAISVVQTLDFPAGRFSKISCLEVLEHLSEENQRAQICRMRDMLCDDGMLVISVPIEIGFASFCKNIARIILRQTHPNTSVGTVLKSLFGIKIDRGDEEYKPSHIGFYYPDFEKIVLSEKLDIKTKLFSPIRLFGRIMNSQVFYIITKIQS